MKLTKKVSSAYHQFIAFSRKKENWPYIAFFLIIFCILLINAFHESYPDEFDNIMGGWYILHGVPIYTGFFTHHGPTAYFLSALIELIGGRSFVHFRIIFAFLIFGFLLWSYLYIRKSFGRDRSFFYLIFIGIISLAGNFYWLHMLLADTLSAYFFAPVVTILLLVSFYKTRLSSKDLIVISILTALTCLCSLTFLYLAIIIYAYSFYLYLRTNNYRLFSKSIVRPLIIFALPYFLFLIYLVITGSLVEYFNQGWIFNQKYYIYNYPRVEGTTGINPLRFAIVIANNFYNSYLTLLHQLTTFNIGFPVNITMAVGSFALIIYAFLKKKYFFAVIFTLLLTYANGRSNPLTSGETDYQSAVYIMMAFLSIAFVLTRLFDDFELPDKLGRRIIGVALFLIIGFYSIFSVGFIGQKFFNRTYAKYMGQAPLIYDNPELAPIINKLVPPNEPMWVGPFEFKELFYINGRPATHYQIFIPGMGMSSEIRTRMIQELEVSKPKVVYFQKNFFILGRSPEMYGQFFIDYLKEHYVTLNTYEEDGFTYKSLVPVTEEVDLESRLYIRKENAAEIIQKLLSNNFIQRSSE
jgi:hypothetical protein